MYIKIAVVAFGIYDPIEDVNFYPNGGARQPQCDPSNYKSQLYELMLRYRNSNHQSAPNFLQSINTTECLVWSVYCDSYDDFLDGLSPPGSSLVNLMGLPAKKIPGLSPQSKFYLRTGNQFPYCLKNAYEPV
ncbi:lipase member I [Caerostris darwini]|uniref:Lipase member I n=1 Tax=Caerostris darwini TaxID=1538125 RepID=A0AAV4VLN3_9ARAC|nr:lipase member I [Caerostris darwini]